MMEADNLKICRWQAGDSGELVVSSIQRPKCSRSRKSQYFFQFVPESRKENTVVTASGQSNRGILSYSEDGFCLLVLLN